MQGRPPDWQDFVGIVVLLLINSTISFIEENNAGNAAAALMAGLAPKTKVYSNDYLVKTSRNYDGICVFMRVSMLIMTEGSKRWKVERARSCNIGARRYHQHQVGRYHPCRCSSPGG